MQKTQFAATDLVNANLWLQILEERLQKISSQSLSLFDFQNQDTVYSSLLEEFTLDDLTVLQQQLLKVTPNKRMEFIKKKMRVYERVDGVDINDGSGANLSNGAPEGAAASGSAPQGSRYTGAYTS